MMHISITNLNYYVYLLDNQHSLMYFHLSWQSSSLLRLLYQDAPTKRVDAILSQVALFISHTDMRSHCSSFANIQSGASIVLALPTTAILGSLSGFLVLSSLCCSGIVYGSLVLISKCCSGIFYSSLVLSTQCSRTTPCAVLYFTNASSANFVQASVREVKRLDAISRSPVYSSIGEEIAGLATIRAYRAEDRLIRRNGDLIDRSVIFSLVNQSMNRFGNRSSLLHPWISNSESLIY